MQRMSNTGLRHCTEAVCKEHGVTHSDFTLVNRKFDVCPTIGRAMIITLQRLMQSRNVICFRAHFSLKTTRNLWMKQPLQYPMMKTTKFFARSIKKFSDASLLILKTRTLVSSRKSQLVWKTVILLFKINGCTCSSLGSQKFLTTQIENILDF